MIPADPLVECVYHLIPEEYVPPPKEKMYQSKYSNIAKETYANKQLAASMGPPKVVLLPTNQFLKKGHGVPRKLGNILLKSTKI